MDIGEKIHDLRKKHGLTLEEVGNTVGVGKSTVRKWEHGDIANMKRDKIAKLATALHTTPAYLMGWEKEARTEPTLESIGAVPYNPTHQIPVLGRISAGMPLLAEEHIEGYILTDLNGGGEYFALRVQGDSMNTRKINDEDIVIVRRQEEVQNGNIAVVMVGENDATIKQFFREGDTIMLVPHSSNPEHTTQIYNCKDTNIKILGKLVRSITDF